MTVEDVVIARLLATSGVTALVSTRVYSVKLPQDPTLPAIRVQLVDEPKGYHLRGERNLTRSRVQVDAFESETADNPKTSVDAIADAIDAALSGETFSIGSPATEVTGVFRQDRQVLYEAEALQLVRVLQDYVVWSRTVN